VSSDDAPVSRAMASASFGLMEDSGKIALTSSRLIVATNLAKSPADGWAWVVCDGMTAPTTSIP
jgi:hypothetical protein